MDEERVDDKTFKERIAICKECPKRVNVSRLFPASKCGECGCLIVAKAAIPAFHCPLKKW
jgi:hypothetical protein